ncbi:MAG: 2OG-Fe(II) oxygenase [Pyrinomonadaceae bacterium]
MKRAMTGNVEAKTGDVIRLTRRGAVCATSVQDLDFLRVEFLQANYIRLANLIDAELLQQVLQRINRASFEPRIHLNIGKEACMQDELTLNLLHFLANNSRFFKIIETITECGKIGCFAGRVYRFGPDEGHFDMWHDDLIEDRLLAMSINLSPKHYVGGSLELCDDRSGRIERIDNTGLGDAIVFRLAPFLRHRVKQVQGTEAKTAFAGWFKSTPDFFATLKKATLLGSLLL